MQGLSREDKMLMGIGVGAVAVIATLGFFLTRETKASPRKKTYGLRTGPQCATYEFTDDARVQETVSELVDRTVAGGPVDPFAVTSVWLRAAAGECTSFPEASRNPGEARLYRDVFFVVLTQMKDKNLIAQDMFDTYVKMIDIWAQSQGVV